MMNEKHVVVNEFFINELFLLSPGIGSIVFSRSHCYRKIILQAVDARHLY